MVQNLFMEISVSSAKGQLTELVRRAEAGDEVILTRHGQAAVRLVPVKRMPDVAARRRLVKEIRADVAAKIASGEITPYPSAARSQDSLYDENGLPG